MNKKFYKMNLITLSFLMMSSAHAYKIIFYTDEVSQKKAQEVLQTFKKTYPFSKLNIEYEIIKLEPQELECGSRHGIDRLIACDNVYKLEKRTLAAGGDQSMIIKDLPKYGGSAQLGGGSPVITTNSPARTMLHEYMHTLGFSDEYAYPASETKIYCNKVNAPNLAFIDPLDPYASDDAARSKHKARIPWYNEIDSNTPITNSGGTRLGTGEANFSKKTKVNSSESSPDTSDKIGLYKGQICNNATPVNVSWHPGSISTIMSDLSSGLSGPIEKIVEKLMISRGAKLNPEGAKPEVTKAEVTKSEVTKPEVNKKSDSANSSSEAQGNNSSSAKNKETDNGKSTEIIRPCKATSK